jgi:hypothetical protein
VCRDPFPDARNGGTPDGAVGANGESKIVLSTEDHDTKLLRCGYLAIAAMAGFDISTCEAGKMVGMQQGRLM